MASLKEMRTRIGSVKSIQKITRALQMVAAAKLRRAQEQAEAARPYARRMAGVIANLAQGVSGDGAPKLLVGTGSDRRQLVIVASADRGLAGGFSSSIARAARDHIRSLMAAGKDVKIIAVGRKSRDALRRQFGDKVISTYDLSAYKTLTLSAVQPIADEALKLFEAGEVDVISLFYSRYASVISQVPTRRQLVPAQVDAADVGEAPDLKGGVYTYEPDEETILEALLPKNLAIQIFSAVLGEPGRLLRRRR